MESCDGEAEPEIWCYNDEDCGTDGYIDDNYCSQEFSSLILDSLYEGETKIYTIDDVDYEVTADLISDTGSSSETVIMRVNGEATPPLSESDMYEVAGIVIKIEQVSGSEAGEVGAGRDIVVFHLGEYEHKVMRDYKDWSCHNGGTVESYCDYDITPQLIEYCNEDEICENGACVPTEQEEEVIFRTNAKDKYYAQFGTRNIWIALDTNNDEVLEGFDTTSMTSNIGFCPVCEVYDPYDNCVVMWNSKPCVVYSSTGRGCSCRTFNPGSTTAVTTIIPTEPYSSNGQEVYG